MLVGQEEVDSRAPEVAVGDRRGGEAGERERGADPVVTG